MLAALCKASSCNGFNTLVSNEDVLLNHVGSLNKFLPQIDLPESVLHAYSWCCFNEDKVNWSLVKLKKLAEESGNN